MWLATVLDEDGPPSVAVVSAGRVLPLAGAGIGGMRALAALGGEGVPRVRAWAEAQPRDAWRSLAGVRLGPPVPDPGAIYAIGLNYRAPGVPPAADPERPDRPLVYGKAGSSVAGPGEVLAWDRSLTANVDAEVELGVVIGEAATGVPPERAMRHVLGYTCINDVSSRDPWLDGDQWLIGKSMPGFCPTGPWIVPADDVDPVGLRLGCTLNGVAIQEDTTDAMRFSIPEVVSYLSRHVTLRPGDLVATGTPVRLAGPLGPERHLEPGDVVTVWIEQIGELTTTIA